MPVMTTQLNNDNCVSGTVKLQMAIIYSGIALKYKVIGMRFIKQSRLFLMDAYHSISRTSVYVIFPQTSQIGRAHV